MPVSYKTKVPDTYFGAYAFSYDQYNSDNGRTKKIECFYHSNAVFFFSNLTF